MKISQIKTKVDAKIRAAKTKLARKTGKAVMAGAVLLVLAVVIGCQNPAQRAQTADTRIYIYDGANVTFGSEFVSLAQSNETGGNDSGQTASPTTTTDIRPDVDVNTTGGRTAGVLEAAVSAGIQAISGSGSSTNGATGTCPDGNCTTGNCSDGSCTLSK